METLTVEQLEILCDLHGFQITENHIPFLEARAKNDQCNLTIDKFAPRYLEDIRPVHELLCNINDQVELMVLIEQELDEIIGKDENRVSLLQCTPAEITCAILKAHSIITKK